jgi:phosphopantetheinyl transferase
MEPTAGPDALSLPALLRRRLGIAFAHTPGNRRGPKASEASRIALRRLLSRQSAGRVPPADWRLDRSADGRPVVLGPETGFHCSIAYGGAVCVVAAARARAVGVDLEPIDSFDDAEIPWHLLSSAERCLLQADRSAFLTIWTLKEALAKERGVGFSGDPAAIDSAACAAGASGRLLDRQDGGASLHCRIHIGRQRYAFAATLGHLGA